MGLALPAGKNRGGQEVTVFTLAGGESRNEVFIPSNQRIRGRFVHQLPCALELFYGHVRSILQEISHPLLMHIPRPFRSDNSGERQVPQKVPQLRGVQNVRVIEDSEPGHDQIPSSWS